MDVIIVSVTLLSDHLILPLLVGLLFAFLVELLLIPKAQVFWKRPLAANLLHVGGWLFFFCVELLLFQRPWFAMANVVAWHLVLILVNNAKYHVLREPFLFYDFEYLVDAIQHPRLYLPFVGVMNAIMALVLLVMVITVGVFIESSLLQSGQTDLWVTVWLGLLIISLGMLTVGYRHIDRNMPIHLDPEIDFKQLGQGGFLWYYAKLHFSHPQLKHAKKLVRKSAGLFRKKKRSVSIPQSSSASPVPPPMHTHSLPDIVCVQSESFFDPRIYYDCIKPSVLSGFDQVCQQALSYGSLSVPAWGANTIRTEAAFLSGVAPHAMGVNQFSPYRHFLKNPQTTVAHQLKAIGYETVCVHPYPASFYQRDKLYPQLGFDCFIDIEAFDSKDKVGQYIGDHALTEQVRQLLSNRSGPIFIYIITMENHGPLHLEKPTDGDMERFYVDRQPVGCEDLSVYLRHLHNADRMAVELTNLLKARNSGGLLCWYGDHVPIMSKVYQRLGTPSGDTRYFIWSSHKGQSAEAPKKEQSKAVSDLAGELMSVVLDTQKRNHHEGDTG